MKRIIIGITVLSVLFFIVLCIGFFLPDQRIVTKQITLNAPKNKIFMLITDHNNWQYRSDLKALKMINSQDGKEIWLETDKSGMETRLKIRGKIPYSFYSIEIENSRIKAYWVAQLQTIEPNQIEMTTTMYIQVTNPLLKLVTFVFFNPDEYMQTYQNDLKMALL